MLGPTTSRNQVEGREAAGLFPPMPFKRSDLDQAVRYLEYALVLIERDPPPKIRTIREVIGMSIRRLSPGR
jgi:hypothetical protein